MARNSGARNTSIGSILSRALLICCALPVWLTGNAKADEMYTYSGNGYTFCSGGPYDPATCSSYKITGWFTTDLSLSALENLSEYTIPLSDITNFSFSDGSGLTIDYGDATLSGSTESVFTVWTNGSGGITQWIVGDNEIPTPFVNGNVADNITTINSPALVQDSSVTGVVSGVGTPSCVPYCTTGFGGVNQNDAGVWSAPVGTPEPSSLMLLGGGLVGIMARRLRTGRLA